MKATVFLIFCVVANCICVNFRVDPLVVIEQGLVRGVRSNDGSYSSFLGVPYAQVDAKNPFGPPHPPTDYGMSVFNAYYGLIKCPQSTLHDPSVSTIGSEVLDCLRLNIYSPTYASSKNPLPVLVWIHGGDFGLGYAGEYGPEHFVKQGLVVVTVNYRLGPYGFLCLDIPTVPGNQGLKDQYEALLWIRKNVASFGGNPNNITIAGQGAGSTSVLLHLYSDKEKVYNKVIAESGTPQNIGAIVKADTDAAIKMATHLGFNTSSNEEALNFLSQTSHELVTAAAVELNLQLKPCKEKSFSGISNFIDTDPYSLSNENKVRGTPILIGHTSNENLKFTGIYDNDYFKSDPFYEKIIDNFNLDDDQLAEASKIVRNFYIGDEPVSQLVEPALEAFESDIVYNHPIQRTITSLFNNNANPIYAYEFSYTGDERGVANSEELQYLFQMSNSNVELSESDKLISDRITTMWANFIKFGNPTPETNDLLPIIWNPVTEDTRPYIVIDTELELKGRVKHDRMAFWDLFYRMYGKYSKQIRQCNLINMPQSYCFS